MSTQPIFIPFRQVPEWEDAAEFVITGAQLKAVQKLFEAYTPFIQVMEPVFLKGLDSGQITIRYEDMEGNNLSKEYVDEMLQEHARITAESLNAQ